MLRKLPPLTLLLLAILIVLLGIATYQYTLSSLPFTSTPPTNYVKGGVIVTVKADNRTDANNVMRKYTSTYYEEVKNSGNNASSDIGANYLFGVNVPVGQEKMWIEKFQKDPAVVEARYQLPSD